MLGCIFIVNSFSLLSTSPLHGLYKSLLIFSPVDGYLGCFQFGDVLNMVGMNVRVMCPCEYKLLLLLGNT
jgi:hypothetical protein